MVSKHKKILIVMLACILLLSMFLPMISFANDGAYFDTVSVMEDLLSSPDFNIYHYGYSETEELSILNFLEYCYSPFANCREYYGLYLYLYNPQDIELKSTGHSVQLAVTVGDTTLEYSNYDLKLLSSSSGDRKNLFHKFKVLGAEEIAKQVKSEKRIYNISGIELKTANGIKDNGIGGIWSFTGYAKGYSPSGNSESTLKSDYCKDIKRVELNVRDTFYRLPGFNANGVNHVDTLSSVYFAVDNKILSEYGNLYSVKAEWFETKTSPIVIVKDKELYDSLLPYIGKVITPSTLDRPSAFLINDYASWNVFPDNTIPSSNFSQLTNLFYENVSSFPEDYVFSGEKLKQYWANYKSSNVNLSVGKNGYSGDLFVKMVDPGRTYGKNSVYIDNTTTFDLTAYSYSSGFDKFWHYLFDIPPHDNSIFGEIYPIRKVSKTDLALDSDKLSKKLFVDKNDIAEFKTYSAEAIVHEQTPYLFSFAVTDYYNNSAQMVSASFPESILFSNCKVSSQTVFLDFDIIELKFLKNGEYKAIPVVSNPIDIAADLTINDSIVDKDGFNWWIILYIILGLILLRIFWKPICKMLELLWKMIKFIVCLPFKLIREIFNSFIKE